MRCHGTFILQALIEAAAYWCMVSLVRASSLTKKELQGRAPSHEGCEMTAMHPAATTPQMQGSPEALAFCGVLRGAVHLWAPRAWVCADPPPLSLFLALSLLRAPPIHASMLTAL